MSGTKPDETVVRRSGRGWVVGDEKAPDLTSAMVLADLLAADLACSESAAASAGSWWRQEYQDSGNPCTSSTSGPLPFSARWIRPPGTETSRWVTVSATPVIVGPAAAREGLEIVWCCNNPDGGR